MNKKLFVGIDCSLQNAYSIKCGSGKIVCDKTDKMNAEKIAYYFYRFRDQIRLYKPLPKDMESLERLYFIPIWTGESVSDPSAGFDGYFAPLYTQIFGTVCLDLCLFNRDLCRGPFSRNRSPIRPICPTCPIRRPPLPNGNNRHIALNIRCLPPSAGKFNRRTKMWKI